MKISFKDVWHEANAFVSTIKVKALGSKAEKQAAKGRLFQFKYINKHKYVNRIKAQKKTITEVGNFKRITINKSVYYWPALANINSLWIVLSEALILEHPHNYDAYPTLLKHNDRVLDIGACEGAFCLHAAKKASQVIAVEPSYTMIEAMKLASIDQNFHNIIFVAGLLGPTNCEMGFQENIKTPEASMIIEKDVATEFRPCWTLDSFAEKYFPNGLDYIKCDAEGADFDILKSGRNVLLKYKPRISVASYHDQADFGKIQNFLEEIGYTVVGQGLFYSPVHHKCYPLLLKAY